MNVIDKIWLMSHISQYNKAYSEESLKKLIKKIKRSRNNVFQHLSVFTKISVHTDTIYVFARDYHDNINILNNIRERNLIPLNPGIKEVGALEYFTYLDGVYLSSERVIDNLIEDYYKVINTLSYIKEENIRILATAKIEPYQKELYRILLYYFSFSIKGEVILENF
jgi:hypothetical protein|nr:MAG TPA: hypothetical protein [Caudoviricetes sp.]